MKQFSLALGRISPQLRSMGMTFRTLINLSNAFGMSMGPLTGMVGVLGAVKAGFDLVVEHFEGIARSAKEASGALNGMRATAAGISARRMLEGGVTDDERRRAEIMRNDAQFRRKNLEDLYLDVHRQSVKGGDLQTSVAKAVVTMLRSGLYADSDINDLVAQGGFSGLFADLEKRINEAASEEKSWESVLKQKPEKIAASTIQTVKTDWLDQLSRQGLYMSNRFAQMGGGYSEIDVLKEQTKVLEKIESNTRDSSVEAVYT